MNPPVVYTRIASVIFLLLVSLGPFSLVVVPSTVFVPGDGAATAASLLAHEGLFRAGLAGELVIALVEVVMVVVLYRLFRPVSEGLALVAAGARGGMAVLQGAAVVWGLTALGLAAGSTGLADAVAQGLIPVVLDAKQATETVWQGFFGVHCLVLGLLIWRSRLVPRVLGLLMAAAGLGYLVMAFGDVTAPQLADRFQGVTGAAVALGEIPFFLWLLIRGVDLPRWRTLTQGTPART